VHLYLGGRAYSDVNWKGWRRMWGAQRLCHVCTKYPERRGDVLN